MHTVLVLNPTSGISTLANNQHTPEEVHDTILAALHAHGINPTVCYTTPDDPGQGLAQQAVQEGAELVIAAGGDGTLHAVASGLIGTQCALGIIPAGTMNNIAHSLEIPESIEEACAIIARGSISCIDVGKINDHIFLEVAGIGLEAVLFPAAEEIKSRGWLSTVHGVIDGLSALFAFRPTRFIALFDGRRRRRFKAIQVSICNSPYYGAHLRFAPNAIMDDGFLDVLIYKNFSKLEYIRHAISIIQGRRALEPKVVRRKIKTLSIYSTPSVEIHADGVPLGQTPATITIHPGVLRVCVPESVTAGPHMASPKQKRTQRYRQAKDTRLVEEKGPLHVS